MNNGRHMGRRAWVVFTAVLVAAAGCQRGAGPPAAGPSVADYLPLEEGRVLVYEMSEGPRRVARVVRVTRGGDGAVRVETESSIEDPDQPVPPTPVRDLAETYRFAPAEGVVYWKAGARPEVVFLKGPLEAGTRWPVTVVTDGAVDVDARHGGGAHRTVEGTCRIERVEPRQVLGESRPCVEVACEFPDPVVAFSSRTVACRGLGAVQTDETATAAGEATPTTLGERLVEVR